MTKSTRRNIPLETVRYISSRAFPGLYRRWRLKSRRPQPFQTQGGQSYVRLIDILDNNTSVSGTHEADGSCVLLQEITKCFG